MAAKTQDAAGETVLPQAVLIAMLDNIEDELRDCTAGLEREPTLRNDLIAIADRLNHVVTALDMKPATPREAAIAAQPGETLANTLKEKWALRKAADFDRILDVLPKGPRCRDCADSDGRCMNEAEPRPPCDPVEHVIELLRSALAARVPAPSAPQEPRGESGEGMVAPLVETLHALGYPPIQHAHARAALRAALSSEARDAD